MILLDLRKRTLITMAISLLLLVVALYFTSQSILMGNLSQIQDESTQKDLVTVNNLLFKDLDDLDISNKHWSELGKDSFYDEGTNTLKPEAENIFNNTGIDLVIISSTANGVLYFEAFNMLNNSAVDKNDLKNYLNQQNNSLIFADNPEKTHKGILLLPYGTFIVSINPIKGSDNEILILGRYLNISDNSQSTNIPGLSLSITPFLTGETVPIFHDINRDFSYNSPIITKETKNNTINGFSLLRDNEGRAVFQILLSENSYIENKGQETLMYTIIFFLVVGLFLGFVILIYLDRIVLFKINKLSTSVQHITKSNDLSQRLPVNGANDEITTLSNAINSLLTSLQRSWDEIQQSRIKYRNIFYNTGTAMTTNEEDGTISLINSEFENLSGFKKLEVEGKKSWEDFFPEDIEKMSEYRKIRMQNRELAPRNYEAQFQDKEGKLKDVYLTVTTVPGTKQVLLSLIDISLLKKSLKEKDALLREVHHRVKNNMQIMISLLNMKARDTDDEEMKNILMESQDRIRSMAMVYDGIYISPDMTHIDMGEYIQRLAAALFTSYNVDTRSIKLDIDVDSVLVNIDTAVPLGLLVNELVSNSIKHAFNPGQNGEIKVALVYVGDEINLMVEDDGIGFPEGFDITKTDSMGMKLIDALVNQLDAKINLRKCGGVCFSILFKELNYTERI